MISKATIARIMETARIEEVISDFITLKKRGVNYIALCPFHTEKTPSFTVSPTKGIYKCFGCEAAGNVVHFIMEHEHYSYPEALRWLAKKYHIEIEETHDAEAEREKAQLEDALFIVTNFAQHYYHNALWNHPEGKSLGLSYLRERGLREIIIKKFGLGFAPSGWDNLYSIATQQKHNLEYLKKTGLVIQKDDKYFDFFRERVLFPIHNLSGKVIAFGGRTLKQDAETPKYINSPDSDIYNKSKALYGLFFARESIRKQNECFLVEGYMDVLALHQGGIENVVAPCGTALTEEQVRLIGRFTSNLTVIFDGDPAGVKAALRSIDLILAQNLNVKIVLLPEGEDPDSYMQQAGSITFKEYTKKSKKDFILFKTEVLLREAGNDPIRRADVIREVVYSIAKVPDVIKRAVFVKECAQLLNTEERILFAEINKLKRQEQKKQMIKDEVQQLSEVKTELSTSHQALFLPSEEAQERDLIRVLLEFGEKKIEDELTVIDYVLTELEDIVLEHKPYRQMFEIFQQHRLEGKQPPQTDHFIHHEDPMISKTAIELTTSPYTLSENWYKKHGIFVLDKETNFRRDVFEAVAHLRLRKVNKQINEALNKIKTAQTHDEREQLQITYQELSKQKRQLCEFLGTVIIK